MLLSRREDTRVAHRTIRTPSQSGPLRAGDDNAVIASSWERCQDAYNLDPGQRLSTTVLTSTEYKERRERMGHLLDTANVEMVHLLEAVGKTGYAMLLTDHNGIILKNVCDPNLDQEFKSAGLWNGADWGEEREGTNGIGTCIAEKRPVTVHLDEHYFRYNSQLTCTAAPILDPRGDLLAVLDSSSCHSRDSRASQAHLRALLCMSATQISNSNFLWEFRKSLVLRFHTRYEYVGLFNEGLIALDDQGRILAANDSAASMLGRRERTDLVNLRIDEIVDVSMDKLTAASRSGLVSSVWPMHDVLKGQQFYAMACSAQTGSRRHRDKYTDRSQEDGERRLSLADVAGGDPQMMRVVQTARKVMDRKIPILLLGETGTGKEVLARAIHDASERAEQPFVAVNCSAIPESLIESELFGYAHGAFTGARRKGFKGRLIMSDGGTIFLDEIGDMPAQLQTRLLRVLEDGEVTPLGSSRAVKLDLNVISATHQNLEAMIKTGQFRADLYYRLRGVCLNLVPLRQRADARELIRRLVAMESSSGQSISDEALDLLTAHSWPGNIRQLRNAVVTALALSDAAELIVDDFQAECLTEPPAEPAPIETYAAPAASRVADQPDSTDPLADAERRAIIAALARADGNVSKAARDLSISRNTLYRKLKRHAIDQAALPSR